MIPGVCWSANNRRWRASLRGYGSNGYIGEFVDIEDAIAARQRAEILVDGRLHDQAQIEVCDDRALIPLWRRRGVLVGWAQVDAADVPLVSGSRWSLSPNGYPVARISGGTPAMHLMIMPGPGIRDHVSGDRLDNRRANLRRCCSAENSRNAAPTRGRVLYKGVSTTPNGRYRARLMLDRQEIGLGRYDTAEAAARAYDAGARQYFGEFARLNFSAEAFAPQGGE